MGRLINDKQFESISALPASERYSHFVRQVTDWEEIWSLRDPGGWALLGDPDGRELIPVWPHARYAEAFIAGRFAGSTPTAIPLEAWLDRWLPGIEAEGRAVAVFPVAPCRGIIVSAGELSADLKRELRSYE